MKEKAIKQRIDKDGVIRIPEDLREELRLRSGQEVELSITGNELVIRSTKERKKIKIKPEIIDQLVEEEEFFAPEWN